MNILLDPPKKKRECSGLVFRGIVNNYVSGNRIVAQKELRLLKSKSCKGCDICIWMFETLHEEGFAFLSGLDDIEHGKLYTLLYVPTYTDWETGFVEEFEFQVREYTDETRVRASV